MAKFLIVGFMGSGKSSLLHQIKGKEKLKSFKFFDLDDVIEGKLQAPIQEIIKQRGMNHFRQLEFQHLSSILTSKEDCIVALGGGTLNDDTYDLILKNHAKLIWLDTPFNLCLQRIRMEGNKRPLNKLDDLELKELYLNRCKYYKKASLIITDEIEKLIQFITSSTI